MLFLILFQMIYADNGNSCSDRTTIYYPALINNNNYFYCDYRTYLGGTDAMSPQSYRDLIKNTISCTGIWCINNEWKCNQSDSKKCYNVEHIIPKANNIKEIIGCSTDIKGNYIMSYGAWNQALSNSYYGEKYIIYGNIVKFAYRSIYFSCHKKEPEAYPEELCLYKINNSLIGLGFFLGFIAFIGISLFLILLLNCHYKNKDNYEYDNNFAAFSAA